MMDCKAARISENRAEAKICATWESIKGAYDAAMAKYQKQIFLPGFRKGKTPMRILEAKIGEEVLKEACFEAMNNSMMEAFESIEEDLRPLPYSAPEIVDQDKLMPFKKDSDIDFVVRFDIVPQVNLTEYTGMDVPIPNVLVSEKMIDDEIERYRNQNSIVKPKEEGESVQKGDLVTVDYVVTGSGVGNGASAHGEDEAGQDGDAQEEKMNDFTFTVGEKNNIYEFDDDVIGLKAGEEKTLSRKKGEKDVSIALKVKSIKVKELPEVDDEFAQDVKSEYKTVADLREGIRKRFSDELDSRMKETKIAAICDKILEGTSIAVPKSMVDYEIETTFRRTAAGNGMSPKDFEGFLTRIGYSKAAFVSPWREDAEKSIKRRLIVNEVEKREQIKADEEKVKAMLDKQVPADADEEAKKSFEDSVRDQMGYSATIDFLISNNNMVKSEKEITYEDFVSGKYLEDGKKESASGSESAGGNAAPDGNAADSASLDGGSGAPGARLDENADVNAGGHADENGEN